MSHNKILGAAIAAALSVGGGTAQAAPSFGVAIGDTTENFQLVFNVYNQTVIISLYVKYHSFRTYNAGITVFCF